MFITKSYKIEEPKKKNTITEMKNAPEGISSDWMIQRNGSTNWKIE